MGGPRCALKNDGGGAVNCGVRFNIPEHRTVVLTGVTAKSTTVMVSDSRMKGRVAGESPDVGPRVVAVVQWALK